MGDVINSINWKHVTQDDPGLLACPDLHDAGRHQYCHYAGAHPCLFECASFFAPLFSPSVGHNSKKTLHAVGLVGTAAAVIVIVGWTWMWPDDFDWYTLSCCRAPVTQAPCTP